MRRGLTLIELLVSILIISILVSIVLTTLVNVRALNRDIICKSNLKQIAISTKMYVDTYKLLPSYGTMWTLVDTIEVDRQIGICPANPLKQGSYIYPLPISIPGINVDDNRWDIKTRICLDNPQRILFRDYQTWHYGYSNGASLYGILKKFDDRGNLYDP